MFGQIRTLNQLYRQSITLEWYVGAVRVWVIEFTDRGRFFHDIFTGNLSFVSDTDPGLEYTGSLTNGGTRMSIDQQVDGDQPPFTFTFAKQ